MQQGQSQSHVLSNNIYKECHQSAESADRQLCDGLHECRKVKPLWQLIKPISCLSDIHYTTLRVLIYTGESRALSGEVGKIFDAAAETFRHHLTTMFKKREQGTSGGKSLQVQVTIYDPHTHSLKMGSDESYELYISESQPFQVMCTDKMFLSLPTVYKCCIEFRFFLFLESIMVFFHPVCFIFRMFWIPWHSNSLSLSLSVSQHLLPCCLSCNS
jgi:hypothetical protein